MRPGPPDTLTPGWKAVVTAPNAPWASEGDVVEPTRWRPAGFGTVGASATHGVAWFSDGGVGCCTSER